MEKAQPKFSKMVLGVSRDMYPMTFSAVVPERKERGTVGGGVNLEEDRKCPRKEKGMPEGRKGGQRPRTSQDVHRQRLQDELDEAGPL